MHTLRQSTLVRSRAIEIGAVSALKHYVSVVVNGLGTRIGLARAFLANIILVFIIYILTVFQSLDDTGQDVVGVLGHTGCRPGSVCLKRANMAPKAREERVVCPIQLPK